MNVGRGKYLGRDAIRSVHTVRVSRASRRGRVRARVVIAARARPPHRHEISINIHDLGVPTPTRHTMGNHTITAIYTYIVTVGTVVGR